MSNNYENNKLSLLSSIPNDASNIIKDFIVETRISLPLKIKPRHDCYFVVSKYKEGYEINKIVNEKELRGRRLLWSEEEITICIEKLQKKYKKHYPVYIDNNDDLVNYIHTEFSDDLYYDDNYYDNNYAYDEPTHRITIKVGGLKCTSNIYDLKQILYRFVPFINKVYKKKL